MEVEGWGIKSGGRTENRPESKEEGISNTAGRTTAAQNQIQLKLDQDKMHTTGVSTLSHSFYRFAAPDGAPGEKKKSVRPNKDLPISVN